MLPSPQSQPGSLTDRTMTISLPWMEADLVNEPVVRLSENAALEVKSLLSKPENAGKPLRLFVEQGGCSGMQYSMTFDEKRPDDFESEMHGVIVVVDPFSA